MKDVAPCLWFDGKAEEVARFYVGLIPGSSLDFIQRNAVETPGGKPGDVQLVEFTLAGRPHIALNGGPMFAFSPAISLCAICESQEELDRIWDALSQGGQIMRCGWLTDRFGVTWQVLPAAMLDMMRSAETGRVARLTEAMLGMVKLDLPALQRAFDEA